MDSDDKSFGQTSGLKQKLFTFVLTLACAGMVYMEISTDPSEQSNQSGEAKVVPGLDGEQMFYDLGGELGATPVVLFVTPWCPVCRALKSELEQRGVSFLLADVEQSEKAYRYYKVVIEQAASGIVPITVVGSTRYLGYVPEEIQLAIAKLSKS